MKTVSDVKKGREKEEIMDLICKTVFHQKSNVWNVEIQWFINGTRIMVKHMVSERDSTIVLRQKERWNIAGSR